MFVNKLQIFKDELNAFLDLLGHPIAVSASTKCPVSELDNAKRVFAAFQFRE